MVLYRWVQALVRPPRFPLAQQLLYCYSINEFQSPTYPRLRVHQRRTTPGTSIYHIKGDELSLLPLPKRSIAGHSCLRRFCMGTLVAWTTVSRCSVAPWLTPGLDSGKRAGWNLSRGKSRCLRIALQTARIFVELLGGSPY